MNLPSGDRPPRTMSCTIPGALLLSLVLLVLGLVAQCAGPDPARADDSGAWWWWSGKSTSSVVLPECSWSPVTAAMPQTGRPGWEHHEMYARLRLPRAPGTVTVDVRYVRSDGDLTGYSTRAFPADSRRSVAVHETHGEVGSGLGGRWDVRACGGPVVMRTRYAKAHGTPLGEPVGQ